MRAIAMTRCPPWLTDLPGERSGRRSMVAKQVFYGFSQRLHQLFPGWNSCRSTPSVSERQVSARLLPVSAHSAKGRFGRRPAPAPPPSSDNFNPASETKKHQAAEADSSHPSPRLPIAHSQTANAAFRRKCSTSTSTKARTLADACRPSRWMIWTGSGGGSYSGKSRTSCPAARWAATW